LKLRILSSITSSIIAALASILLYRYSGESNNSNIIFIYITSQQIAGLATIFFLYGAQFEIKEKISIPVWNIIISSVLLIPFLPIIGVSCLLFSRTCIQKFGKIQASRNLLKIIFVSGFALILYFFNSNWFLIGIAFVPFIPMLIIGETVFEAPNIFLINYKIAQSILLRSSIDLALLLPIIVINFLTKYYLSSENYLDIQKLIFCLSGLAIVTSTLEKIIFDKKFHDTYKSKIIFNNFIILIITYIGVTVLASILSIKIEYWWYLTITPLINLTFTALLAQLRGFLGVKDCIRLALIWAALTVIFTIFASILLIIGINPVVSVITSMIGLSLSQLGTLFLLRKLI
jgi:hypothetical protein